MKTFNVVDTAAILIDHQVVTSTWASTTTLPLLQRNVIVLAKFAKGSGIPGVLTSSQKTNLNVQGPLMPELQETPPEEFAARIKRQGVWSAWATPAVAAIFRNTGRKNFVRDEMTTVCAWYCPRSGQLRKDSPSRCCAPLLNRSVRALMR